MNSDLDLLSAIQRTSFAIVASECFQAYDHILTLHEETQFVWTTSWGIGKLLYFLTRYSPYVNTVVSIWAYLGPSPMPDRLCNTLIKIDGWACVVGLLIAETIMVLRVWAMWNQSRKCGCLLLVLAATFVIIGCIMFAVFARNTSVMLVLTVIKGLRDLRRKPKCSSSSFMFKLYRDGVAYYTVVAGISFANVIVLLFANPHFAIILVAPQRCVHSVFSARILLRLREDACRREREQVPATLYTAPACFRAVNIIDGASAEGVRKPVSGKKGTRGREMRAHHDHRTIWTHAISNMWVQEQMAGLYDHIITFHNEVQYVWSGSWCLGKVLYFLTRYSPYLNIIFALWRYMGPSDMPTQLCDNLIRAGGWINVFALVVAEVIMLLRVWAMHNQSRRCGVLLLVLAVACAVFGDTALAGAALRGCHFKYESNNTFISYLVLMVFEIIMLNLTVIKGLKDLHPISQCSSSSFLFKFYQDGVLYYVALASISLANVLVLLLASLHFAALLAAPQHAFHSILSARILLRLRKDAYYREKEGTLTGPVGSSIFVTEVMTMVSNTDTRWRAGGERTSGWFGDANSNVGGAGFVIGGGDEVHCRAAMDDLGPSSSRLKVYHHKSAVP
ncbi:hypothetical protein ONZ45_g6860 [Pleurotus djamor]|nr:hypothetical protein ONZ45_g6860 [Pleurotus djamor]